MFTGIIEEVGKVISVKNGEASSVISISAKTVTEDTMPGDSIAVNGVCLTAVKISDGFFEADVMAETLRRSNLKRLKKGDFVNLERAMRANGRFGGHIVSGHIDTEGEIISCKKEDMAVWVNISCPAEIMRYVVNKGSVAIDGISLTVSNVFERGFAVSIIPHTGKETILLDKKPGDKINIECDILSKYVESIINFNKKPETKSSNIDIGFLSENGFL